MGALTDISNESGINRGGLLDITNENKFGNTNLFTYLCITIKTKGYGIRQTHLGGLESSGFY